MTNRGFSNLHNKPKLNRITKHGARSGDKELVKENNYPSFIA